MLVELNEKDLRAIRKVLSCINEDTDELDDADLPVGMDPEEYHKQKSKQSSLKSKVIEAWKDWIARLAKNAGHNFNSLNDGDRVGTDAEDILSSFYKHIWGSDIPHSSKIDELTFYKCIIATGDDFWSSIDFDDDLGHHGYEEALSISYYYMPDEDDDIEHVFPIRETMVRFEKASKNGTLGSEYDRVVDSVYDSATHKFASENKDFLAMIHRAFTHKANMESFRSALYVLSLKPEERTKIYQSFLRLMNCDKIYRHITIELDHEAIKNRYFKDRNGKFDKDKWNAVRSTSKFAELVQKDAIDLKNPGKSWSWEPDNWDGNCTLTAYNDKSNIDMPMSAICLGNWSTVAHGFKGFDGEQEVRVLDETKVDVTDVEFEE